MAALSRQLQWLVWGFLALVILAITGLYIGKQLQGSNRPAPALPIISQVPPFTLTNQLGAAVTLDQLLGNVWVADIIFTRCPGPCPKMTGFMSSLQSAFPAKAPARFVTLTTDPGHDTPEVLRAWSKKFEPVSDRWSFLTGPKAEIVKVVVDGLKLTALDKDAAEKTSDNDLFIHSTIFIIIDKKGQVRASVESLEEGAKTQLTNLVNSLLLER